MLDDLESVTIGEFRQSLLRGYARLRQAQAQGRELADDAETVLELLGDPQVLTLEHSKYMCNLRFPLVYVAGWKLGKGCRVRDAIKDPPDSVLTLYKRRHDEDAGE